ncbi:LEA type 2 family protein [Caldimonas sp. KR1-144]|uniref:LEA type 2 family protein n=1 Tax=Caldimonas sp. KR1-144 TaxID=3400911 RepID=UPI003C01CC24
MPHRRSFLHASGAWVAAMLSGCAALSGRDPVQVQVAGIEPLAGEGLELRFLVKLRIQNPNDAPIAYDGVFVDLAVNGSSFATGVSDAAGSVPRFGEAVLQVPVTASALRLVRQAIEMAGPVEHGRVEYQLRGKLSGPAFIALRFESHGRLELPGLAGIAAQPAR